MVLEFGAGRVVVTLMRTELLSVAVVVIASVVGYWRLLERFDAASGRWSVVAIIRSGISPGV